MDSVPYHDIFRIAMAPKPARMKRIFLLLICLLSFYLEMHAQTAKWFIGFSTGFSIGGPGPSIKNDLTDQHFTPYSEGVFTAHYFPTTYHNPCLLLMAGKQITKYGSLYLLIGRPTAGLVDAYRTPTAVVINYSVLQFTLGYQFTFPNSHFKLGLGPSIFVVNISPDSYFQTQSATPETKPGLSMMARIPLGKEKKAFGVELFFEMNMAEQATVGEITVSGTNTTYTLETSKISMVYAVLGISFAFRK